MSNEDSHRFNPLREDPRKAALQDALRQLESAYAAQPNEDEKDRLEIWAPLGRHIEFARKEKGYTRAHLSKITGITQNSLARYELAGLEGGQYPPLPKMASLCMALGMDPRQAMQNSIAFEFVKRGDTENYCEYLEFAQFLRTLDIDESDYEMHWSALACEIQENDRYRKQNRQLLIEKWSLDRRVKQLEGRLKAIEIAKKRNGSDHKDPSRPSQNTPKAVDAAPNHPKRKDDQT